MFTLKRKLTEATVLFFTSENEISGILYSFSRGRQNILTTI